MYNLYKALYADLEMPLFPLPTSSSLLELITRQQLRQIPTKPPQHVPRHENP